MSDILMRNLLQLIGVQVPMFGKAKCKLCGQSVRFALRHLKQKHPNIYDNEVTKMKMANIMEKYFV
jgi:hypothetical protein